MSEPLNLSTHSNVLYFNTNVQFISCKIRLNFNPDAIRILLQAAATEIFQVDGLVRCYIESRM